MHIWKFCRGCPSTVIACDTRSVEWHSAAVLSGYRSQLYKTAVKSLSVGIDLKILVHSGCLRPIHQNRCIIFIVKRMSEDKKLSPGRTPTKTKCSVIKIRSSSTLRITLGVQRLESHRYEHVASSSLISAGASSNELRDHVTCLCQQLSQRCTLSMKHSFIVSA